MGGMISTAKRRVRVKDVRDYAFAPAYRLDPSARPKSEVRQKVRQAKAVITGNRTTLGDLLDRALERMDARR